MPTITSSEQFTEGGRYIFVGTATTSNGEQVTNPVTVVANGVMHATRIGSGAHPVCFDKVTETFGTANLSSITGITASLSAKAPFLEWGSIITLGTLPTKETTLGKIIPTEEVRGLNNLNVIEDEPSDI